MVTHTRGAATAREPGRYRNVPAVEVALQSIPVVTPHVRGGRMKALGVTTAKRSAMLPDVPTIAESGVEGYEFGNGHSWFAPRGTPGARFGYH